jgi:hypothetical protein
LFDAMETRFPRIKAFVWFNYHEPYANWRIEETPSSLAAYRTRIANARYLTRIDRSMSDSDRDGRPDPCDNCPSTVNTGQADGDGDLRGNACDNCISVANIDQLDTDRDLLGDACDADDDGDTLADGVDNCALTFNPGQEDSDSDGLGDACDPDDDNDGVEDGGDNCPWLGNPGQGDVDRDQLGDACDDDIDGDGWINGLDNCPFAANADQSDLDGDGFADACDACPRTLRGLPVDASGCSERIPGDMDRDGDVDQADFGRFQLCLSGPWVAQALPECQDALLDGNDRVDIEDIALFRRCMVGANQPGDSACRE